MTQKNPLKDWELQRTAEPGQQWQLLDTEQELPGSLQLQPDSTTRGQHWQPVEYDNRRGGRGGWILPSLIVLSMLSVVGYIVWLGMFGGGIPGLTATAPEPTAAVDPAVVVVDTTATVEPTATATIVPTDTPPPAPTATATPVLIHER